MIYVLIWAYLNTYVYYASICAYWRCVWAACAFYMHLWYTSMRWWTSLSVRICSGRMEYPRSTSETRNSVRVWPQLSQHFLLKWSLTCKRCSSWYVVGAHPHRPNVGSLNIHDLARPNVEMLEEKMTGFKIPTVKMAIFSSKLTVLWPW